MPQHQLEYITSKIERKHRFRKTKFTKVPAIIAKFNDWSFKESTLVKSISSIFVSQMLSSDLTTRKNSAMLARKNLKKDDPTRIRKEVEKEYSLYEKY